MVREFIEASFKSFLLDQKAINYIKKNSVSTQKVAVISWVLLSLMYFILIGISTFYTLRIFIFDIQVVLAFVSVFLLLSFLVTGFYILFLTFVLQTFLELIGKTTDVYKTLKIVSVVLIPLYTGVFLLNMLWIIFELNVFLLSLIIALVSVIVVWGIVVLILLATKIHKIEFGKSVASVIATEFTIVFLLALLTISVYFIY